MKVAFLFLVVLVAGTGTILAGNDHQPVFINQEGGIHFGPPPEYVSTGLSATPEAMKYLKAIEELLDKDLAFLPVAWKITDSKMVGFQTWQVVKETELVLVRSENVLDVRPPVVESERTLATEEIKNPFGLLAVIFFLALLISAVIVEVTRVRVPYLTLYYKKRITLIANYITTITAIFATKFVVGYGIFTVLAVMVAGFATFLIVFDFDFYFYGDNNNPYRRMSGIAAVAMAIAVFLALYN